MAKTDQQIRSLINNIFLFGDGSFDEFDTKDLFELLVAADNAYHNTQQPIIDDAQYDALRRYLEIEDPTNNYFLGVGSEVRGGKVKLPYPMGSLTQAYEGDTMKWINQYKLTDKGIVVTEKLDGISCLLIYGQDGKLQIAYSRGDGIEGADITRHISKIKSVPKQVEFPCAIRAEIIFSKKNWESVKTKITRSGGAFYKNARNATAGLMNASQSDPIAYDHLSVVAYEIVSNHDCVSKNRIIDKLEDFGFITPKSHTWEGHECTDDRLTALLNKMREESEYEIDGIVLEVNKMALREKINPTRDTLNPEYARKFKIADTNNYAETEIIEIEWRISKNGYLKPRLKLKPVDLVGVTIQHATAFNAKFVYDNKLGPGAVVGIVRAGDVIPFVQRVVKPMPL